MLALHLCLRLMLVIGSVSTLLLLSETRTTAANPASQLNRYTLTVQAAL